MFDRPLPSPIACRPRAGILIALLTTGLAASTAFAQPAALKPDALPTAETVSITALPRPTGEGHNARLDVRYEKGQRLPDRIELQIQGRPVYLQRDPKNPDAFAAAVPFDFERFVSEQARRKTLAAQGKVPVFAGREIVDHRPVAFLDPATLTRQIEAGQPIRIPKDVVTGTAGLLSAERSLMVVHPLVVEDPTRTFDACTNTGNPSGVWTFAHLMTEMANQPLTGIHPADFAEDWLKTWVNTAFVNTFEIAERDQIISSVIGPWPRDGAGRLKLEQAPMRLLAIVNRVDLRKNAVYGGGSAGEGRFVFGVMRRSGSGCSLMRSTVILEYGVPIRGCAAVQDYGTQWHALDGLPLGSLAYNAALQDITDQFTKANAAPGKPNGSAINQIRTNENALNPVWELREFGLDATTHLLTLKSTELTPHRKTYNPFPDPHTSTLLADFINMHEADILAGTYTVPETFLGEPFLTGASLNPDTHPDFVWKHPDILNNEARHVFSLNTCDSCHGGETGTGSFLHVEPRSMGSEAGLSRFLVGSFPGSVASPTTFTMPDPVSGVLRTFGDLLHRQADLDALVSMSCPSGGLIGGLFATVSAARTH